MTEFHADDYGLFLEQSERILACFEHGVLNGTSIISNGSELDACLQLLPEKGMQLSVHLNLMQGRCLAPVEEVPLLADGKGQFRVTFAKLLFSGFTGKRESYKQQIKVEYRAQIRKLLPLFRQTGQELRIDGHAHWHVVPVAFDALMEVIREESLPVTYIRMPDEPLSLYLRHLFRLMPFPGINIVKVLLLKLLVSRNRRKWNVQLQKMEQKLFLGVMLSGNFDYRRMKTILPAAESLAAEKGIGLEILAHPGSVHLEENLARVTNQADYRFFTSPAREEEGKAFLRLKETEVSGNRAESSEKTR